MWSDRETHQDCLGYATYVEVLANICTHKDLAPLTLGIFGPWGCGKTSLMEMLRRHIEATKGDKKRKTLWFNAWMYEGSEEARSALIHALLGLFADEVTVVGEAKDLWNKLKKGASVLKLGKVITKSVMTMSPDIDGLVEAFDMESERIASTMESFDGDLKRLMQLVQIDRVVVFIDDLDRCSSAKVIETFETIKLFLNTPTCTFVIGADAEKIKHAVGEQYGAQSDKKRQKDYLEKIVQIPFSIPAQDLRDIACYVGMLIVGRHVNDQAQKQLTDARKRFYDAEDVSGEFQSWVTENKIAFDADSGGEVSTELTKVLPHINVLARGLQGNPRQIKRFLNILSLRQQLGEANKLDTDAGLLVKFAVLEYVWDDFFNDVAAQVDPTTGKSELLEHLIQAAKGERKEELSETVAKHVKEPGLADFLVAEPAIGSETNLQPYLFLAQTSLGQSQSVGITTIDESTKALVRTIEGTDGVPARAAAVKASLDPSVAGAVFRKIVADLSAAKDQSSIANMLAALAEIGTKNTSLFPLIVPAMNILASGPTISLGALTLIEAAEKAGVVIEAKAKAKFGESKIAAALSKPRTSSKRGG